MTLFSPRNMFALAALALACGAQPALAVGTADGNVPIGTTTVPTAMLGVYGAAAIGTSYISTTAPTNGLIVQGNVGIGTTSPIVSLDLSQKSDAIALPVGNTAARPTGTAVANGEIRYNSSTPGVEAYINGAWSTLQSIGTTSGLLGVSNGGTGDSTLTAHGVLVGEGTAAVNVTSAGTAGYILTSGGASADPAFAQLNLGTSAAITGTLPVTNGGTGTATQFTPGSIVFAGTSGLYTQNNSYLFWDNTNNRLGIGTTVPTHKLTVAGNIDLVGTTGVLTEIANDTSTGTTQYKLAKLTTAGAAVATGTSDIDGIVGVVVSSTAASGNAQIAVDGQANCVFDGATTAGDYVVNSTTVIGDCHDSGSSTTRSTTSQTIGRVLSTNVGAGTYAMTVKLDASTAGSGAVTGTGTTNYVAKWTSSTALGTGEIVDIGTGVGIGTTSPSNILVVYNTTSGNGITIDGPYSNAINFNLSGAGKGTLGVASTSSNFSNLAVGNDIVLRNSGNNIIITAKNSTGNIMFASGSSDTEKMRISNAGLVGIGTSSPAALLHLSGNQSASAWTSNGIGIRQDAATYTDTSSSGTVSANYVNVIGQPTLAASSATTYSNAATFYIAGNPASGSNVTLTNSAALWVNGASRLTGGTCIGGCSTYSSMAAISGSGGLASFSSWTTSGAMLRVDGNTLTDTSGSGTIATRTASSFAAPTFAASGTETITNAATVYIAGAPSAGTNTTITNALALDVAGGTSYFGGKAGVGIASPQSNFDVNGNVTIGNSYAGVYGAPTNGLVVVGSTGIGTSSPTDQLQVAAATGSNLLKLSGSGGSPELYYLNTASRLVSSGQVAYDVTLFDSGSTYNMLTFNNNGTLGVGTTTPKSALDIYGGLAIGTGYAGSTAAPTNGMIVQGNVGIGTGSPSYPLHVYQNTASTDLTVVAQNAASGNAAYIKTLANGTYSGSLYSGTGASWFVGQYGNTGLSIKDVTSGTIPFVISQAAPTNTFYVGSTGLIGIGSSSPIVSLDLSQKADAIALPVGNTAARPTGTNVANGEIRYNSSTPGVEAYINGAWSTLQSIGTTSGLLGVSNGGTGDSTLTAHGVLVGEGTAAVAVTSAGTSGYLLTGGGASADPTFAQLNLGTSAAITGTLGTVNGGLGGNFSASTGALSINAGTVTAGTLSISNGGTGQTTAATARASSGLDIDEMTSVGDAAYTILSTDRTVATSATLTAARIWTLPAASSINPGQQICVVDKTGGVTSTNTITIARAGTDTINGSTTYALNTAYQGACLISDGTSKWSTGATAGAITGSGTTNYVARWTPNGTTLGTGEIVDIGTGVGIGTTVPGYLLDVENTATGAGNAIYGSNTGAGNTGIGVYGTNTSSAGFGVFGKNTGGGGGIAAQGQTGLIATATSNSGIAILAQINPLTGNTGYAGYFNNNSSTGWGVYSVGTSPSYFGGNVGIGTTTVTSLLTTSDSAAKTATYTGILHGVYDTSTTSSINKIGMDIESTGVWTGTSAVNTGLVVNATGGTTNYAATFSGGNVGIGTTSPSTPLYVNGATTITGADATELSVTTTSSSGTAISGVSSGTTANAAGVYGSTIGAGSSFVNYGVYGTTNSNTQYSAGVYGSATGTSGQVSGVFGTTASVSGFGVYGQNTSTIAGATGIWGNSSGGIGVYGNSNGSAGVKGADANITGAGVNGTETYASNSGYGVYGLNSGTTNTGYGGYFTNTGGGVGLYASSTSGYAAIFATGNVGIGTTAPGYLLDVENTSTGGGNAIYGNNTGAGNNGAGVYGNNTSASGFGVVGVNNSGGSGVAGTGTNNGVIGIGGNISSTGVLGKNSSANNFGVGVYGQNSGAPNTGYGGYFTNTGGGVGLYASSTSGYAAIFATGNVGIGSTSPIVSLDLSQKSDAIALPVGNTAARPTGTNVANGEIRYNSSTPGVEAYINGAWSTLQSIGTTSGTLTVANGGTGATSLTGYVYGNGTSAMTASTTIPLSALASQAANTLVGALTATNPSALSVPSCSTTASALMWTSGTGFSCNTAIAAPAASLTGTTLASNVVTSSLTTIGTVTTGTWTASIIGAQYGGTGLATLTSNVIYKGNGTGALATSALTDNGTIVTSSENVDAKTNGFVTEITNNSGGTTVNKLAKLTSGQAVTTAVGDTDGIIGVVIGGAGTSGTAQIAVEGQATCTFDGTPVVGDFVVNSTTTAGDCHDTGSTTRPTGSQTIGRVMSAGGLVVLGLAPSAGSAGAVTGSGLASYVARWTGTSALGTGTLYDNGSSVAIGSTSPQVALDVTGTIYSRAVSVSNPVTTIDWSQGNTQYTADYCGDGGNWTFSNMQNGGTYTLVVEGSTSGTCAFQETSPSTLTFKYPPNFGATTASTATVFSFAVVGTYVFVSWTPGYSYP